MRILLTIHHGLEQSSGAPGTTMHLASAYESRGHDVRILSYGDIPGRNRMPVQVQQLVFPFVAAARALRRFRWADVVDGSSADLWPLLLLRRQGALRGPVFVTRSHGLEHSIVDALRIEADAGRLHLSRIFPLYHGGWRLHEVAISLRHGDAAFFLNDDDRDYAVGRLGVRPCTAFVMNNGLSATFIGLRPPPVDEAQPTVMLVGSFSPRKGIAHSVPALTRVLDERPAARVALLGAGVPAGVVLAAFPRRLHPRITVTERFAQAELPALLAGAAISVSASLSEGFGKAILETMACGLVPVAASASGPRRVITDGEDGLLVPAHDADSLARGVMRLLDDPALRRRLAAAAHRRAQGYTWEATADHRLRTYEALIARRSS